MDLVRTVWIDGYRCERLANGYVRCEGSSQPVVIDVEGDALRSGYGMPVVTRKAIVAAFARAAQ